uniref:ABC-type uncharacterized transport system involved in gliding motility, auxiliary component n=1 Tax=Candidatus Kentrum eta TaxID=2126337 RepID=A0A450UIC5_9GAMM|nr:MAG: ABC-type uncharacterized transport system involved in gliding motility, auxiliary component [Candidatus Kentron sp. H]VFJ93208.1 MAG: ABC-type uncharacterized transport system involved in gliding motility, auxiliary component [Candidatus Kentron sp. H]VFK00069.1 MAG: ABC-type uncharacterized transport system involved in gliding motility, auxiliary component [Candidatus Kentron sp. H]
MNMKWFAGGGLVLAVVLLFAINIFSAEAFRSLRLDLTEGQLYTLSEGTRNILSTLEEPVTLRLFLSQKQATRLPGINSYTTRVRELLEEYRRAGDGLVRVHVIEPEPFSEEEDRALGYGLTGVPLSDEGDSFYFGLVGSGPTDMEVLIPFFSTDREAFLEYDLTSLIYQVAYPDKKTIGLISSLPMDGMGALDLHALQQGQQPIPWTVFEEIHQGFEVRVLENDIQDIPAQVGVLMLVHPKGLGEKTLYAIDQFVLRGGRALVFVDPHAEADAEKNTMLSGMSGPEGTSSDLEPLFAAWGIGFSPAKVVGDTRLAERVRFLTGSRATTTDYPIWMRLSDAEMDPDDMITTDLDSVLLASPGRFRKTADKETRLQPLLQTTVNAKEFDAARVAFLTDPKSLLRDYQGEGEQYILAARVTGQVESAFPNGAPEGKDDANQDNEGEEDKGGEEGISTGQEGVSGATGDEENATPPREHLSASKEDINVIVVADTDMLRDQFWVSVQSFLGTRIVQPTAANGTFVLNAMESLIGSNDLISIRSRGHFRRPFTRVDTIREEAEFRFRNKEKELLDELRATERKLVELERGKQGEGALVLSQAQKREIERFRQEKLRVRRELRDVRHELRKNIERMENRLKFVNIGLVPLLIGIGGIVATGYRIRRRKIASRA